MDTSALIAVLYAEPEQETFLAALARSTARMSAASYLEAGLKLIADGLADPQAELARAVETFEIQIVPVDFDQSRIAVEARLRYGKGRHPAGLNYGDCFVYALAKVTGEPLLYKGEDFARTDIVAAL